MASALMVLLKAGFFESRNNLFWAESGKTVHRPAKAGALIIIRVFTGRRGSGSRGIG